MSVLNLNILVIGLAICAIFVWVYYIYWRKLDLRILNLKNIRFKTGDLILFKNLSNKGCLVHGEYFLHVGIVVIMGNVPMLFEADRSQNGKSPYLTNNRGIYLSDLPDLITRYRGKVFYKPISYELSPKQTHNLIAYIGDAFRDLSIDLVPVLTGLRRLIGINSLATEVNCGQLIYNTLCSADLISETDEDAPYLHHLKYVANLIWVKNNSYPEIFLINIDS